MAKCWRLIKSGGRPNRERVVVEAVTNRTLLITNDKLQIASFHQPLQVRFTEFGKS